MKGGFECGKGAVARVLADWVLTRIKKKWKFKLFHPRLCVAEFALDEMGNHFVAGVHEHSVPAGEKHGLAINLRREFVHLTMTRSGAYDFAECDVIGVRRTQFGEDRCLTTANLFPVTVCAAGSGASMHEYLLECSDRDRRRSKTAR